MSLRGFFNHTGMTAARSNDKPNVPSPAASTDHLAAKLKASHLESQQIRDIKGYMSQAGLAVYSDPIILEDLSKAERSIMNLPSCSPVNMDSLATLYQLIPREEPDSVACFREIHQVIMRDLLPDHLNETVTLVLTFGQANAKIKRQLLLNIRKYLALQALFTKESAENAVELFRAALAQTSNDKYNLDVIMNGLISFYKHSKKKIESAVDLQVIMDYIHKQSKIKPFIFDKNSGLILLYSYDMLTDDNLAHLARNNSFVDAVRVCARYYTEKDYTFPPVATLRTILTNLKLSNYLIVIGQFLIKKLSSMENATENKATFIEQIYALLLSARACQPNKVPPNPHNSRYEDDIPRKNDHVRSTLDDTFHHLLSVNNIDEFGTKKPIRRGYW